MAPEAGQMIRHPFADINGYHRLPVAVLETYLRPGCACVVCREAQAQIAERSEEATA